MKLTERALKAINTPGIRIKLAAGLECTEGTIIRYIGNNDDNLTKAVALKIIKQETGLSEHQILKEHIVVPLSRKR